jgi:hypothetical protein
VLSMHSGTFITVANLPKQYGDPRETAESSRQVELMFSTNVRHISMCADCSC